MMGAVLLSGTIMPGNCEGPLHKKLSLIFSSHVTDRDDRAVDSERSGSL